MRSFAPLVAFCMLAISWSGCATPDPDARPASEDSGTLSSMTPAAVGDEGDPAARLDAAGAQPHVHDYWRGRERVTLFDGDVDPGEPEALVFATTFTLLAERDARVGAVPWRLPNGSIVFEGTGAVELTATPTEPTTTSIAVRYRAADSADYAGPVNLASGAPTEIEVTAQMTDMPHAATSRWEFLFQPEAPGAMLGQFRLKVDIVRTRDPSAYPGHPDRWAGASELVLLDGLQRVEQASTASRLAALAMGGDAQASAFAPAAPVPMETTRVRAEVQIVRAEAQAGEVVDLDLSFRGADTFLTRPAGPPVEGSFDEGWIAWDLEVTMEMTDSPYADDSQWRFVLRPHVRFTGADAEPECAGCVDSEVEAHVRLIAFRDIRPMTTVKAETP